MNTKQTTIMHTIEELIREIPKYPTNDQNFDVQYVILDSRTGEVLDELPILPRFRNLKYFEINRKRVVLNISGPQIEIPYLNAINPIVLTVKYDAQIIEKGAYNLARFVNLNSPAKAINDAIENAIVSYMFTLKDFALDFYKHKPTLVTLIENLGKKIGLELKPNLSLNIDIGEDNADAFVNIEHNVIGKTGDGQNVEIKNYLALTLIDPIRFSLSGVSDLKNWLKSKLEQYTKNAVIERTYADILINTEALDIKIHLSKACERIGYGLKQLITTPGLENEKIYFETAKKGDESSSSFSTKDPKLQISLNIVVHGRLNLHDERNKEFIKPNIDIIAGIRRNVVESARDFINIKTPDECFIQVFEFEQTLTNKIISNLNKAYVFKEIGVLIKFLENDLSKRIALLQERPCKIELSANWSKRNFQLWFRILSIHEHGWYRFRTNNYPNTEGELNDIGGLIKNWMESAIMRPTTKIDEHLIKEEFEKVKQRIIVEFGLCIRMTDFREEYSIEEQGQIQKNLKRHEADVHREILLIDSETDDLAILLRKRKEAIETEESEEVVESLDKKIKALHSKDNNTAVFLEQKTGNNFLLD